jgi:hypothetical protein
MNGISKILKLLREISHKKGIKIEDVKFSNLSEENIESLKMKIRNISPQVRGKIVTSRGAILPFSKTKNLNLDNTPILILMIENQFIDVYPHQLGTQYVSILDYLQSVQSEGIRRQLSVEGLLEEPIIKILSENPSILGKDLVYVSSEVDVGVGKPDILFKDSKNHHIVVEVESEANDFAIGQISRGASGLISKKKLDPKNVRKAIVCLSFRGNLKDAAKGAGIELYQLALNRLV